MNLEHIKLLSQKVYVLIIYLLIQPLPSISFSFSLMSILISLVNFVVLANEISTPPLPELAIHFEVT